jgi:lipopolysaccharide assembly protein A
MKIQWTLLFALLFALITTIFAVVNVEKVTVNYVFGETNLPLILVIVTSTLLGGLIVGSFGIVRQYKLQRTINQLEKQLREAQNDETASPLLASDADKLGEQKLVH